jgi:U3 small nucleolar RNA-associated protein 18
LSKKSQEELSLEETLFGSTGAAKSVARTSVHHQAADDSNTESDISVADESDIDNDEDEINFVIDTAPSEIGAASSAKQTAVSGSAVWHDEDDDQIMVDLNGSNRLKKLKTGEMTSSFVSGSQYTELLQNRYDSKKQSWATAKQTVDSDEDEDVLDPEDYLLLTEAGGLVKSTGGHRDRFLPIAPEKISMKRLVDANITEYSAKAVSCMQFHPLQPNLFLVASEDKNLRVFDLDGKKNEKVLGVHFKDLPILNAAFIGPLADEIIVTGRKPYFYCYSMSTGHVTQFQIPHKKRQELRTLEKMCVSPNRCLVVFVGHEGSIHMLDTRSKQWVWEGKMNCSARSAHFLSNSILVTSGFDAEVYHWEVVGGDREFVGAQQPRISVTCQRRMQNEDGTSSLSLTTYSPPSSSSSSSSSLSSSSASNTAAATTTSAEKNNFYCIPDTEYLCVGAMSGVASIFQRSALAGSDTEFSLMKSIMNLTTKVTSLAFHPSGQLLVIASNEKKDQLKLVHLPSGSVYMNWPKVIALTKEQVSNEPGRRSSPLHRVTCVQFSPDGSRLAIGNGRGRVLLYQVNHFTDYHERRYLEIQAKKQRNKMQRRQQDNEEEIR